jgi:hypothetical protein
VVDTGGDHPAKDFLHLVGPGGRGYVPIVDPFAAKGVSDTAANHPGALPRIAELLTNLEHRPCNLLPKNTVWHLASITLGFIKCNWPCGPTRLHS